MLDTRGSKQESFMQTMMNTLETNKKRYDRQLYADWLTKVYDNCANACIKNDFGAPHTISELREVEKQCGKNCIRKFDKAYRLYEAVEGKVLITYVEDNK